MTSRCPRTTSSACTPRARKLIPALRHAERRAAWAAARPLVGSGWRGDWARAVSHLPDLRSQRARRRRRLRHDHRRQVHTLRGMAELCADVVCRKLGIDEPCRTRDTVLLPHTAYYDHGRGMRRQSDEPAATAPVPGNRRPGRARRHPAPARLPLQARRRRRTLRRVRRSGRPAHAPCSMRCCWIQLHRDPSLTLRHSCLHASCGTCGMQVDGREELACVCSVHDHGAEITVEPLANLPILTDLVVEMTGFFARFPHEHPIIRSSEPSVEGDEPPVGHHGDVTLRPSPSTFPFTTYRAAPPGPDFMRLEDCIECGLCLSACPVASTSHEYVGPAALGAAERLLEEPRGVEREDVLAWASRPEGVWRCHVGFECTRACPTDAIPAERIMALRRELIFGQQTTRRATDERARDQRAPGHGRAGPPRADSSQGPRTRREWLARATRARPWRTCPGAAPLPPATGPPALCQRRRTSPRRRPRSQRSATRRG